MAGPRASSCENTLTWNGFSMSIYEFKGMIPEIDPTVYLAPSAQVIGAVRIAKNASVWFNCVLRGDVDAISIGEETNIQDLTMCHVDSGAPLKIGSRVTIGHQCVVHGCTIENNCLIGMGAVIMSGSVIGQGSIVAAGALILENTVIPPLSLVTGIPAKIKRRFKDLQEMAVILNDTVDSYLEKALEYRRYLRLKHTAHP